MPVPMLKPTMRATAWEQETEKTKKFALEKFAKDLLDTVDNLERAIENSQSDNDPVLEGVEHKSLIAVLEKYGVKVVNPQGEILYGLA
ncbi:MAG: nucleotide exchange factor GrpE [Moraxella sp.]